MGLTSVLASELGDPRYVGAVVASIVMLGVGVVVTVEADRRLTALWRWWRLCRAERRAALRAERHRANLDRAAMLRHESAVGALDRARDRALGSPTK